MTISDPLRRQIEGSAHSDGDIDVPEGISVVVETIIEHFNNRWGGGAPVTNAEAGLLANRIASLLGLGADR